MSDRAATPICNNDMAVAPITGHRGAHAESSPSGFERWRPAASAFVAFAATSIVAAQAKPLKIALPEDTATFKPGANRDVVMNNCTACHSSDYVQTQPRGAKFKKDFWQAEVTKMIKVYGAPIDDADVGKIVEYLTENY
jgi:mono/diheme cytochrome c family protein